MHAFSIFMAAAVYASTVTGLATPQLSRRFSVPGASSEDGFTIPKGVQPGIYEVFIDDSGVAHHTQLAEAEKPKNQPRADHASAHDGDSSLGRRQEGTVLRIITCGDSREMNRGSTDDAVGDLVNQGGNGRQVQSGYHIYSVRATWLHSTATIVWNIVVSDIGGKCGSFNPGWSEDIYAKQKNSVGYHEVGGDKNFCGEGHF
ncbi:aryl-alcohol dehydrogenase [Fusarium agapanthi]|uniref:Aryl-alcohol dehydrogenase n=1 Tax=Fusarium agapanthi TaxID=1803897 RepID=A0A9P5EHK1_9HYPO|nr:aryl-alcohol dehydrogenase [Fusarium agapanthi]